MSARSFKLVLLGDSSVGKSSLVLRFTKGHFLEYQESTIGAAFQTQSLSLDDNVVKFELWDTAGQERYRALAPMYYRGANIALVVYDVTSRDTFENAILWITELRNHSQSSRSPMVIFLVGNKMDLVNERVVSTEEGKELASKFGLSFAEVSAKEASGVNQMFVDVARQVLALPPEMIVKPKATVNVDVSRESFRKKWCGF